jgi:GTP-binding protein
MKIPNYNQARFLISVAEIEQLPADAGTEVAFVGRSNVGKSSALNALTRQKKLVYTSKTPGRTQLINLFSLSATQRLVDLPGYGYAKVAKKVKQQWGQLIDEYLTKRKCLRGLVLLMDIRHPLQEFDVQVIKWAAQINLPLHILLTKADKLSRSAAMNALQKIRNEVIKNNPATSIQLFSAVKSIGREELKKILNQWFGAAVIPEIV